MSIDGVLGSDVSGRLRKAASGQASSTNKIPLASGQLQPGETIAVPLAITFVTDDFGIQSASDKFFKRIRAAKPGSVFQEAYGGSIRKMRESFNPPRVFKATPYTFGPELRMGGVVIDGKSIVLDQASRNFMQLASYAQEGSCPLLYSWDERPKT